MTRKVTIDFEDRLEEMEERLDHLGTLRDYFDEETSDIDPDEHLAALDLDAVDSDEWDDLSEEARDALRAEVEDLRRQLEHAHQTGVNKVTQWSGSQFEIKELTWGDQAMRNDLARGDMLQNEYSDPRANQDAERIRTVQVATVSTPPDAPEKPREYPPVVGEWLYEKIENLNTYGEVNLDDFSDSAGTSGGN